MAAALELGLISSAWLKETLRTPEPEWMVELVEESYRETARILADLGARDPATWQPVPST